MRRADLNPADILPSDGDGQQLWDSAVKFMENFMVGNFQCLHHLKSSGISLQKSITKSEVIALDILDIDESSTDNNIAILERFCRDVHKSQPSLQV